MYARRSLQYLLDELKDDISLEARTKLAGEMDRLDASALSYEWELALIYALSQVGDVTYEAEFKGGTRRPDISFASTSGSVCFVADVTTISDTGLEQENPVMRFSQALHKMKRKCGLKGSLHHRVEGDTHGPDYRNRKTRLKLPKISEMDPFLEQHVAPHFRRIAREKLTTAAFSINEPEFSVTYNEAQRYSGGSYPSYRAAQSLKRNPVYSALKSKREQLKNSGADAPLGVFLCDGGCALLSQFGRQHMQFSLDDVINEFFREYSSIAFVAALVFPPPRTEAFLGIVKEKRITGRIYTNPRAKNPITEALLSLVNRGLAALPVPVATPTEAIHWISQSAPNEGQTIGKLEYGGFMVKMSARKIQEVLAGKITPKELFADYTRPGERQFNPFERALNQGLTIAATNVIKVPDQDDDLIEIVFGLPDPAIRKFEVK